MTDFTNLPLRNAKGTLNAVIETPCGSTIKYEFDPGLRVFTISKFLSAGLAYPAEFGFLPSTIAEDGDPLDAVVIHDAATFPGLVIKARAIGVLEVLQTEAKESLRNDRIVLVPSESERQQELTDVRDLPANLKQQFEKFFQATDELEDKKLEFLGWRGRRAAEKLIARASKAYLKKGPSGRE